MKNLFLLLVFALGALSAVAQYIPDENSTSEPEKKPPVINSPWTKKPTTKTQEAPTPADNTAESQVANVIEMLFHHMRSADGSAIKSLFTSDARLQATGYENGRPSLKSTPIADFANGIGQAQPGALDERITGMEVRIDEGLASAWVDYDFYLNGEFHHCGVDAVQLHKGQSGWKIMHLADTRRDDCVHASAEVDQIMTAWHAAASSAKGAAYFDLLASSGVYLGTDASENWTKEEFQAFAKPFFDKGQAWDFKATERNVFFSDDGSISWFNEVLDTWMGPCRGSGVLKKNSSGAWKLEQYNLAMLVPNDLVQDYLALKKQKGF